MKKIQLMVMGIILLVSVPAVYAQTQGSSSTNNKTKNPLIEKTQGKISAITKSEEAKGELGGFAVISESGKTKEFKLIPKTRFFSPTSAPAAFSDLKKGDKVTVLSVVTLKGDNDVITVTQNK